MEPAVRRDDGRARDPGGRRDAEPRGGARPPVRSGPGAAAGGGGGAGGDVRRRGCRSSRGSPTRWPRRRRSRTAGASSPRRRSARHLSNDVEPEVVRGAARRGGRGLPEALAPLLCAEGEVAGAGQAAGLGPQRAAAARGRPQDRLGGGEGDGARRPMPGSIRGWRTWRSRSSSGAGSTPASSRARRRGPSRIRRWWTCIPYVLLELPRQEPRRDDAGARAGARGAPAAGGGAGGALVVDAADAGGDGERLRRDADLPAAAGRGEGRGRRGRSCWPRRSRT